MNSSERTYLQKLNILALIEPEGFNAITSGHTIEELNDCDEEIAKCQEMLDYYIAEEDQNEVKNWKQLLQQAKTRKRVIRKMIHDNKTERDLLTT